MSDEAMHVENLPHSRKNLQFLPAGPFLSPHTESQTMYHLPNVLEKFSLEGSVANA